MLIFIWLNVEIRRYYSYHHPLSASDEKKYRTFD